MVWRRVARDTGGELLHADSAWGPGGFGAAEHIHAKQEERFEVLAGLLKLQVRRDGENHAGRRGRCGGRRMCGGTEATTTYTKTAGLSKTGGYRAKLVLLICGLEAWSSSA